MGDGEESLGVLITDGLMDQDKRSDFIPVGRKILGGLVTREMGLDTIRALFYFLKPQFSYL